MALYRYDIHPGKGIYTDMNAIRRDEELDNLHSVTSISGIGRRVITPEARTLFTLHQAVTDIVSCICDTQLTVRGKVAPSCAIPRCCAAMSPSVTAQELEDLYPRSHAQAARKRSPKSTAPCSFRASAASCARKPHDGRAPDYDDWDMNGDILFWQPDSGQRAGNLLHGHPRQPGIAGSSVDAGGLRRPPQAAVPTRCCWKASFP